MCPVVDGAPVGFVLFSDLGEVMLVGDDVPLMVIAVVTAGSAVVAGWFVVAAGVRLEIGRALVCVQLPGMVGGGVLRDRCPAVTRCRPSGVAR